MEVNDIILYIMLALMAVAGIDRFTGSRFGLGDKFEEGFNAMGPLTLGMVGAICLAPGLGEVLGPIIGPVYESLGADPAMFAGTILANDMGGYHLALSLAGAEAPNAAVESINAGNFSGLILGSMLGPTIAFAIPVALSMASHDDRPFLARGFLVGLVTIPLGCLVGGLVAGYPFMWIIINLVPVLIVAVAVAVGLFFIQDTMVTIFLWFGKLIIAVLTIALVCAGLEGATGLVLIEGMAPINDGFVIVGNIAVVLAGAFALVLILTKVLAKPLEKAGTALGMNTDAAAGMLATLANSLAMFAIVKKMNDRGKVLNFAFAVSAGFTFGDHLAFTAGMNKDLIVPVVVGKLVGGLSALTIAYFMTRNMKDRPI